MAFRTLRVSYFLSTRFFTRGNKGVIVAPIVMIALIYINVLFIPSLIQGAIYRLDSTVTHSITGDLVISPLSNNPLIANTDSTLIELRGINGIEAITPIYSVNASIVHKNSNGVWQILAIDPGSYSSVFDNHITIGQMPESNSDILLGQGIAGNGLEKGFLYTDSLKGVELKDTADVSIPNFQSKTFHISGVFSNDLSLSDERAIITQSALQQMNPSLANKSTSIHIKLSPKANVENIISQIEYIIPNIKVKKSTEFASTVREQVLTTRKISTILSFFSFIVASITLFIVTYVDLVNRRKQIGIERAIGISNSSIVITYIIRALISTVIGIIIGALIYLYLMVPYYNSHPFGFPVGPVSLLVDYSTMYSYAAILSVIAIAGAVAPTLRAVKLSILDAIWS